MYDSEQIRQISNKNNEIAVYVNFIIIVVCIIVEILFLKGSWTKSYLDLLLLVFVIIALIVLIFSAAKHKLVKNMNEVLKNLPYGFDYGKEFATYRIIGRNSKKVKNGAERFSKYSEWKQYLDEKYAEHKKNDDFYRFLRRMLRSKIDSRELFTTVLIPIEIAALTVFCSVNKARSTTEVILFLIILAGFLVLFLTLNSLNIRQEVDFLEDFIEVLYGEKDKKID